MLIPEFLKPGDTIGITATARKISPDELAPAIRAIELAGFKVKIPDNLYASDNQLAGTGMQRAADFMQLISDSSVNALLCARGGYGTAKMLEYIDTEAIIRNPKWLCGYSDVTVLHLLYSKLGLASMHSTMPINFPKTGEQGESASMLFTALTGEDISLTAPAYPLNVTGECSGELIGGNLSLLYALQRTDIQVQANGKILFFEDLDEYLYHIDRMMLNLRLSGVLSSVSGIAVGYMNDMNDNTIPYGKSAEEIVYEHTCSLGVPVAFGIPAGHMEPNLPLRFGTRYKLAVNGSGSALQPL